jgi:hypothetical protein
MENIFDLGTDVEEEKVMDSIGKRTFDSGVVKFKIKMAYLDESAPNPEKNKLGGARNINLILESNGRTLNHTEYISSAREKGQSMTYEKNGKKFPLPGYSKMNDLCKRATGKELKGQTVEEKQIKIWDFEARKELPQLKNVLMDLVGKTITAGVIELRENKFSDPTQEMFKNEIDKWFDPDTNMTTAEIAEGKTEAKFIDIWKKKWDGKLKDTYKPVAGSAGAPAAGGAAAPDIFN